MWSPSLSNRSAAEGRPLTLFVVALILPALSLFQVSRFVMICLFTHVCYLLDLLYAVSRLVVTCCSCMLPPGPAVQGQPLVMQAHVCVCCQHLRTSISAAYSVLPSALSVGGLTCCSLRCCPVMWPACGMQVSRLFCAAVSLGGA